MYQYKGLLIRTNRRDVGMVPSAGSQLIRRILSVTSRGF